MESNFTGKISAELNIRAIEQLCLRHVPFYDPMRFKIVAIRVYSGNEFIVTVYASDSFHQPIFGETNPVKKFKIINVPPSDVFNCLTSFNFTLFDEQHKDDAIVVTNK